MLSHEKDNINPSSEVVETIADEEDVSPIELLPLYESIDPDALDTVVTSMGADSEIVFEYSGYVVTISALADDRASVNVSEK